MVPYYFERQFKVGLISLFRSIVADSQTDKQGNVMSIEVPRGFGIAEEFSEETAIRELGEETQRVVQDLKLIGHVNPNTGFYKNYGIPVFAAEIDRENFSELKPDASEKIFWCKFYTKQEIESLIRDGKVFCALSKSALLDFFSTIGC